MRARSNYHAGQQNSAESNLLDAFQQRFASVAGNSDEFHTLMQQAFGANYDKTTAEGIRQQTLAGDLSWMPRIEVVDAATLADTSGTQGDGVALGAYDGAGDRIYLTCELLAGDPNQALAILSEEVSHALDVRLNVSDSAGDEGELSAALLSGDALSEAEIADIRADDDSGVVVIDGVETEVEYGFLKRLGRAVTRAVRDFGDAVSDVVQGTGDLITDGIDSVNGRVITPLLERLGPAGKFVNDRLVQPSLELIKDGVDISVNIADSIVYIGTEATIGTVNIAANLAEGDVVGATNAGIEAGRNIGSEVVELGVETVAMALHATANYIDGTLGISEFAD